MDKQVNLHIQNWDAFKPKEKVEKCSNYRLVHKSQSSQYYSDKQHEVSRNIQTCTNKFFKIEEFIRFQYAIFRLISNKLRDNLENLH